MESKELNVTEMEQIAGGANKGEQPPKGGSSTPLPAKSGCKVYRVVGDDNLTKIARNNGGEPGHHHQQELHPRRFLYLRPGLTNTCRNETEL